MVFEDGHKITHDALQMLLAQKQDLGCPDLQIYTIPEFLQQARTVKLERADKEILVEQAALLIDQFYAHLPFKRARYAADPVQSLRLIHGELDRLADDLAFHGRMIKTFMHLRDAHTFYGLPVPYKGSFALLPFRIECYYDEAGRRRYVVTDILEGFDHPFFRAGAEVIRWQGMSVDSAIDREADLEPGGNPSSRFVRGIKRLTRRALAFAVPPEEEYVSIEYLPVGGGDPHLIVLPWHVASACFPERQREASASSVNESMEGIKRLGEMLWKRKEFLRHKKEPAPVPDPAAGDTLESRFPQVFEFQHSGGKPGFCSVRPEDLISAAHPDQRFGYIRIKSFELDPPVAGSSDAFVNEFQRILIHLHQAAPDGLILDIRSNPGGSISAAERVLQMLTAAQISPANFHFVNSRMNQRIAARVRDESDSSAAGRGRQEWLPWTDDLLASVISGAFLTPGRPLSSPDLVNDTGQIYQGPVVLLTDGSSYSAADIFAAGFQDHQIGAVIGVHEHTGGGGANRWLHEELRVKLGNLLPDNTLKELPGEAQMGLAIRRSTRVGAYAGAVLEDEGVRCDLAYKPTRNDILNRYQDLIHFACDQLGAQPTRKLHIVKAELLEQDGIGLTVETQNMFRIDCFVNGLPQASFAVQGGIEAFLVPTGGLIDETASQVRVDGYAKIVGQAGIPQLQLVVKTSAPLILTAGDASTWEKSLSAGS
jgi:hypothetical protein